MMHFFKCEISIRFSDDDVCEWLCNNGEIDEDDLKTYKPTPGDLQRYAWKRVEDEECEYDDCHEEF